MARRIRRNADEKYRKVKRRIDAFLQLLLDDGQNAHIEAASQLNEIIEFYGKELRRQGSCKNKVCVQYKLLADMLIKEAKIANAADIVDGTEGFGYSRLVSLLRRNKKTPENWGLGERHNIAKAILGGLDRHSAEIVMRHLNMPVPTGIDGFGKLEDLLTKDGEICITYLRDDGLSLGRIFKSEYELYQQEIAVRNFNAIDLADEDFVADYRNIIKDKELRKRLTTDFNEINEMTQEAQAWLYWRYRDWSNQAAIGSSTIFISFRSTFLRNYAIELAYEARGWL